MKQNRNYQILAWILAFLPAVAVAALYSRLPDQLPMQWDFGGQVRYEPKWHIWIIAGLAPLFCAMFSVLPKIDPRRRNYAKFGEAYQGFQCMMMVFLTVMVGIVLTEGLRPGTVEVRRVVIFLMAALFLFIGNQMPKFRQNYFCGVKTPWTLSSETVWNRTHRLAGRLMFAAGAVSLIGAFTPQAVSLFLVFGSLIAATLIPAVMSYRWYQQETGGQ